MTSNNQQEMERRQRRQTYGTRARSSLVHGPLQFGGQPLGSFSCFHSQNVNGKAQQGCSRQGQSDYIDSLLKHIWSVTKMAVIELPVCSVSKNIRCSACTSKHWSLHQPFPVPQTHPGSMHLGLGLDKGTLFVRQRGNVHLIMHSELCCSGARHVVIANGTEDIIKPLRSCIMHDLHVKLMLLHDPALHACVLCHCAAICRTYRSCSCIGI